MKRFHTGTLKTVLLWAIVVVPLLLLLLWLLAIHSLFQDWSEQPYLYEDTSPSPRGDYTVSVWRSDGQWSFGPARAKVVASSGDMEEVYETKIADDGGTGWANVTWLDDTTAQVELDGSEQKPEVILVNFSGEKIDFHVLEASETVS